MYDNRLIARCACQYKQSVASLHTIFGSRESAEKNWEGENEEAKIWNVGLMEERKELNRGSKRSCFRDKTKISNIARRRSGKRRGA